MKIQITITLESEQEHDAQTVKDVIDENMGMMQHKGLPFLIIGEDEFVITEWEQVK